MNRSQLNPQGIDLSKSSDYLCEECDNHTFTVVYQLRQISALVSPSGEDMIVPVQLFACSKCGHVNKDFLPESGM
jgi:hypothetical protein